MVSPPPVTLAAPGGAARCPHPHHSYPVHACQRTRCRAVTCHLSLARVAVAPLPLPPPSPSPPG